MDTYNPIGQRHEIKAGILGGIRLPELTPGYDYVFSDGQTGFYPNVPGLTKALMRQNNYQLVYMVDTSAHRMDMQVRCQCRNTLYHYDVLIRCRCKVANPVMILQNNVTDMHDYLLVIVQKWADQIVGQYDELQYENVKHRLEQGVSALQLDAEDNGVFLESIVVSLEMDERVKNREVTRDKMEYDLSDSIRSAEMQKIMNMKQKYFNTEESLADIGNRKKILEMVRQEYGEQYAELWADKFTGGSMAEDVYTKARQMKNSEVMEQLEILRQIKDGELADNIAIGQAVEQNLLKVTVGGNGASKEEESPFTADDLDLEDDGDE